jgi:hypothetical protein
MPMPETPVYKHGGTMTRKNQIGTSWQACAVKPKSQPQSVEVASDNDLGLGILGSNARHHPTSRRPVDDISHVS